MPNSLIAFLSDSVQYFPKIPNRTEPNNTEPKLRYSVNSVRFGPPLFSVERIFLSRMYKKQEF